MNRDGSPLYDPGINADARARGLAIEEERPGLGKKSVLRIFGIHAALDRVSAHGQCFLCPGQPAAGRNDELRPHEIDASHRFGDRMPLVVASVSMIDAFVSLICAGWLPQDRVFGRSGPLV